MTESLQNIKAEDISPVHELLTAALCEALRRLGGSMTFYLGNEPVGGLSIEIAEDTGEVKLQVAETEVAIAMRERADGAAAQ